ncbi:mannose-1-phosphate guanylyltransferase/mannose-6-phosphate isomerase [Photobacterium proteolyticum]|uniref:mannose-1-phosphate guanylyltransferase n=1 Tax=Photobacterium proteolyticum TaxID=1903952 RepID=A0A1Q9GLV1_9GAMM|nr:mannose-1-phosphate guanylyltransferase/mannose-6-phosphate isomerase [Photobacterium proteolyticum]OLQ75502.1 mannose-1-phosphate guanylyltransferase/mannose-6-phosphate isomerase [Photobacterium proteolyticum]
MDNVELLPVIMAGGSGSRLWPLSRSLYPKQFLPLMGKDSMLQETIARLAPLPCLSPMIICNEEHRFVVAEQLRQRHYDHCGIVLEPVGRNTAPAITAAALMALELQSDPLLLILAADHAILNPGGFTDAVSRAIPVAEEGKLVTFGCTASTPETGYGYINIGKALSEEVFQVKGFVEKPDLETAEQYVKSEEYLWNSGMFLFKASAFLHELEKYHPDILAHCKEAIEERSLDLDFVRLGDAPFRACPSDSVDYAVMEKSQNVAVVPMDASWSDIGSWQALWDINRKDDNGNVIAGDVFPQSSRNCYINAQHRLVSVVGADDLIVVETKDAILVANKHKVQEVRHVVTQLQQSARNECLQHQEVFRPWGSHDAITEGHRYHVKKVRVKPGEKTTTQVHYNRAEHWVVVTGTARVQNGDKNYLLSENESTYIPIGSPHSFENPGKVMLEIIEVRTGSYLDDDDIERLDAPDGYL